MKGIFGWLAFRLSERVLKPVMLWSRDWKKVGGRYTRNNQIFGREFAFEVAEGELRELDKSVEELS